MIDGKRVAVQTTATELARAEGSHTSVVVVNPSASANAIEIGGADVEVGTAVEVAAGGESPLLVLEAGDVLYGIALAETEVQVLITGASA